MPSPFKVLFPSEFKTSDVKGTIFFRVVVVVVNHLSSDVSAASFASVHAFNVLDGETAHAVGFDAGTSFVKVNDMLVVESFNDRFFLGAEKGDEVVFGDEVFHGVIWLGDKISDKGEKSRKFFQLFQILPRLFQLFFAACDSGLVWGFSAKKIAQICFCKSYAKSGVFDRGVMHGDKISEKGEKSRVYFNSIHFIKRKNVVFHLFKGFSLFSHFVDDQTILRILFSQVVKCVAHDDKISEKRKPARSFLSFSLLRSFTYARPPGLGKFPTRGKSPLLEL